MASCVTSDLMQAAGVACMTCLDDVQADAVEVYLLCRLADQGLPSAYVQSLMLEEGGGLLLEDGSTIKLE